MPGVYTGHTGGGVEYDTERTGGDRQCQREESAVTPACLETLKRALGPRWRSWMQANCNNGIHSASPSVPDALVGVL